MRRIASIVFCLGLAACGGQEQEGSGLSGALEQSGAAAKSAKQEMEKAAGAAREAAESAAREAAEGAAAALKEKAAAGSTDTQSCLDLVGAGKFSEAVPVCTRAVAAEPQNQAVKDALAKAQQQAAGGEAAAAAAGEATDAAKKAAEGAVGDLGGKMP